MVVTSKQPAHHTSKMRRSARSRQALGRRLAALAGAAGAATVGSDAHAAGLTLVPTAGVSAASGAALVSGTAGIPGFSFTNVSTITSGTLRPPASPGSIDWDVDGNGIADFQIRNNGAVDAAIVPLSPFTQNANGLLVTGTALNTRLRNAFLVTIGATGANNFVNSNQLVTNYNSVVSGFSNQVSGQFGFRFAYGNTPGQYRYGWASLTPDLSLPDGQGFTITQAYYSTSPIAVGAVPVPEPSGMALLAIGSAGVAAWRARKKQQG